MALYKPMLAGNGVPVSYHRVALFTVDVNNYIHLVVHSYVEEAGRAIEKDYANGLIEEPTFPYVDFKEFHPPYDPEFCLDKAYEWLKQQPEFAGAIDI